MKLRSLSLILSAFILPQISTGQQGLGDMPGLVLPEQGLAEASVLRDNMNSSAIAHSAAVAYDEAQHSFHLLPAGGRSLQPGDTTRQKRVKKAEETKAFQKPKVSGKTSKRKARKAKTSWH